MEPVNDRGISLGKSWLTGIAGGTVAAPKEWLVDKAIREKRGGEKHGGASRQLVGQPQIRGATRGAGARRVGGGRRRSGAARAGYALLRNAARGARRGGGGRRW